MALSGIAAGAIAGSVEEWVGWMGACRVGCRKALGYDAKRRRYWAFGAGLGAWKIYVEEQEGALWGWYEGMHNPTSHSMRNRTSHEVLM